MNSVRTVSGIGMQKQDPYFEQHDVHLLHVPDNPFTSHDKMYSSIWLAASLLLISAIPTAFQKPILPNPPPCVRQTPAPSQAQTEARFQDFVGAFIGPQKNITAAFEYITVDYIVSSSPKILPVDVVALTSIVNNDVLN